jgi:hypothetical protein
MKSPETCFVAHFDILGMKAVVKKGSGVAWDLLCNLSEAKEETSKLSIKLAETGKIISSRVKNFAFSDTVFLYTSTDTADDLLAIVISSMNLFQRGIWKNVPLRGGIAHGEMIVDENVRLFAGRAIVDAYEVGERAQWLGISTTEDVAKRIRAVPITFDDGKSMVRDYGIPIRDTPPRCLWRRRKVLQGFALDWPYVILQPDISYPVTDPELYERFAPTFGQLAGLPGDVRAKYSNTTAFINECLKGRRPIRGE